MLTQLPNRKLLPGGGGRVLPNISYIGMCLYRGVPSPGQERHVPSQWVWFLSCFGLKTGIDFDHYGLKSGMVFKGTTGAYK